MSFNFAKEGATFQSKTFFLRIILKSKKKPMYTYINQFESTGVPKTLPGGKRRKKFFFAKTIAVSHANLKSDHMKGHCV
jgi:hypothetical protein